MKKIVSLFMAIAMCFSLMAPAFAATSQQEETTTLTMEKFVELMGVTMEDVEGLELKPLPTVNSTRGWGDSTIPSELPPGAYYEEVPLEGFTGAIHKIKGPRFKFTYLIGETTSGVNSSEMYVAVIFTDPNRSGDIYNVNIAPGNKIESRIYKNTYNHDIYFKYNYVAGSVMPQGKALMMILVYEVA
jgi:hypothetical protein